MSVRRGVMLSGRPLRTTLGLWALSASLGCTSTSRSGPVPKLDAGLACEVELGPPEVMRFDASAPVTACEGDHPPAAKVIPQPPYLVGRSTRGDVFAVDRYDKLALRIFGGRGGDPLTLVPTGVSDTVADADTVSIRHHVRDGFFSGLLISLARASPDGSDPVKVIGVAVEYGPFEVDPGPLAALLRSEPLSPVADCGEHLGAVSAPKAWWHVVDHYETQSGARLVIVQGKHELVDESVSGHLVFFGPPGAIRQRDVSVSFRTRDGGSGRTEFLVDGVPHTLRTPPICRGLVRNVDEGCRAELEVEGTSTELTARDTSDAPPLQCQFSWVPVDPSSRRDRLELPPRSR